MDRFRDRQAAGQALAEALAAMDIADPLVLALPRGGVPVAAEVARALNAPLDLVMVRKIGMPGQPELAAGAVVNGDAPELVINEHVATYAGLSRADIDRLAETQLAEIRRRRALYLQDRPHAPIAGQGVIVVDDGVATGATALAALKAVRRKRPGRLVLAVPVAPPDTLARLSPEVDDLLCLASPRDFRAVGQYFDSFTQVPDAEVVRLLKAAGDRADA